MAGPAGRVRRLLLKSWLPAAGEWRRIPIPVRWRKLHKRHDTLAVSGSSEGKLAVGRAQEVWSDWRDNPNYNPSSPSPSLNPKSSPKFNPSFSPNFNPSVKYLPNLS